MGRHLIIKQPPQDRGIKVAEEPEFVCEPAEPENTISRAADLGQYRKNREQDKGYQGVPQRKGGLPQLPREEVPVTLQSPHHVDKPREELQQVQAIVQHLQY